MTRQQKQQWDKMREALRTIADEYQSPEELRCNAEREYGLPYEEALEMAYENVIETARAALEGLGGFEEMTGGPRVAASAEEDAE